MKVLIGPYKESSDSDTKREVSVEIDKFDTWNMDRTLAYIILPMLKQLKETSHSSGVVADEDLPPELRLPVDGDENWNNYAIRWAWVIDQMIWSFEQLHLDSPDWEDQFFTGAADWDWEAVEGTEAYRLKGGPNHTLKCDEVGRAAHSKRINNGLLLFGKYYRDLWD